MTRERWRGRRRRQRGRRGRRCASPELTATLRVRRGARRGRRAFSILANSHSLLQSGQLERVRSHLEMQSRWKTWPHVPQEMDSPSSDALVGFAWYSMDGSCSELRQMAHVSVQMLQLHTATAFHFFTWRQGERCARTAPPDAPRSASSSPSPARPRRPPPWPRRAARAVPRPLPSPRRQPFVRGEETGAALWQGRARAAAAAHVERKAAGRRDGLRAERNDEGEDEMAL